MDKETEEYTGIPLHNSIRVKILIPVLGVLAGVVVMLTWFDYQNHSTVMEGELKARISFMKKSLVESEKSIANQLVFGIEENISSFNFYNVIEQLNKIIVERDDLKYALLIDQSSNIHVKTISPGYESVLSDADAVYVHHNEAKTREMEREGIPFLELILPVDTGSDRWGLVKLGYSLEKFKELTTESKMQINEQNFEMVLQSILTSFVFILIGSVIVLYYANRISSPLIELAKDARLLAKGDFSRAEIVPVESNDEIGILSTSFYEMSRDLKSSYETLEEYSKSLKTKVKERTNDLELLLKELQEKNVQLRESQEQLVQAEKLASLGSLVAGLAHEINTPIGIGVTSSSYFNDMVEDTVKNLKGNRLKRSELEKFLNDSRQCSQLILQNLQRTASLITSFKMVASDQTSEEKRKFQLRKYCEDIITSLRPQIKKSEINVEFVGEEDFEVYSYPGSIAQIITNLVMNSITHGFSDTKKGTISIHVKKNCNEVILEIEDNGKGIPSDNLKKVFDPFYTTKRGEGGTGLGLHIVFNIVHSTLKGTIRCHSPSGKGACFIISMPIEEVNPIQKPFLIVEND